MLQDDSKQCEHLLSQENGPSYSYLDTLYHHSISLRSQPSRTDPRQTALGSISGSGRRRTERERKPTSRARNWTILGSNPIYWSTRTTVACELSWGKVTRWITQACYILELHVRDTCS